MTAILGISAFYHDSAAALLVDGALVAAAQEERFSRQKYDDAFPTQAIACCLEEAGLTADQLDFVAFYDKPLAKFDRLLETYLAYAPAGLRSFSLAMPLWLGEKLHTRRAIRNGLGGTRPAPLVFLEHHESHAASAFFPGPFEEAALLTLDGVGEWCTATFGTGQGNRIRLTQQISFPHSLGLLYSAFTYYCGFRVNGGEHKLMGLAPYGQPRFAKLIQQHLIDIKPDGSFRLNMDYFHYCQGLTMTSRRFEQLFGGPPRVPESALAERHADLAASIQCVTEEVVLRIARHVHAQTGQSKLVMAGGVALNAVANGRLRRDGPFDDIWIQPAAGDAGGALGAAYFVWHQLLNRPRATAGRDAQAGSLLGPGYANDEVVRFLEARAVPFQPYTNEAELLRHTAALLAAGKVVGWYQGRMEFGPRALGARSILGDARSASMQSTMNLKIKFRESFRPFAPAVLREQAHEWFDLPPGQESPYMLFVSAVREQHRLAVDSQSDKLGPLERLNVVRSTVPAITHVNHSARVQTVDAERSPRFQRLLKAFHEQTGCPLLVNTSFNVRGEPIVCSPQDAWQCFLGTEMDVLVMEDCVVLKEALPAGMKQRVSKRTTPTSGLPWSPDARMLRQFAALCLLIFGALAGWQAWRGNTPLAVALLVLALGLGPTGLLWPSAVKPVFVGWMLLARPVGWLVSHLLLAILYHALFTPLGLFFRLIGRDRLQRQLRPELPSYWEPRPTMDDPRRYLRQY